MSTLPVVRITVRDETLDVDFNAFTALDGGRVRVETQKAGIGEMSLLGVMEVLSRSRVNDLDTAAVIWWLARRQHGHQEALIDVLAGFPTYGQFIENNDLIQMKVAGADGEPASSPGADVPLD
jgi:hypothetical protein